MISPRGNTEADRALALGALVRKLRRERRLTLNQLAERVPMSASNLSRIELGSQGPPADEIIERGVRIIARRSLRIGDAHVFVYTRQMRMLLEEGAREEDETLKAKWVNLLAHGLVGENDGIPRAYADMLRQLEPDEALTLDRLADGVVAIQGSPGGTRMSTGKAGGAAMAGLVNLEPTPLTFCGVSH